MVNSSETLQGNSKKERLLVNKLFVSWYLYLMVASNRAIGCVQSLGNCDLYLHWCFNMTASSTLLHCNGEVFSLESIGLSFAVADVFIFRQIIEI
jgi:hypothetical protein